MKATISDGAAHAGTPVELVSQGHAVIRIENETLAQVALQRPRDEAKVLTAAIKELDLVPEEAARAYYEIPYRDTAPGGEQRMVKVSGPSIRAATALARRWGNCSATARILSEDAEGVDLEGVFIDYETSVRFTRPQRVSKWMRTRRGMLQLDGKRLEAAIAAGGSKAMRNAILTGLPAYLVSSYDKRAREIAGGKAEAPLDARTRDAILRAFSEFDVEAVRLEGYLSKPVSQWTGSDRASLVGLYNALKDGQTTVADVFGVGDAAAAGEEPTPAAPTDLLAGATVTGQDMQEPGATGQAATDAADPRSGLLAAIAAEVSKLSPQPDERAWAAICKEFCGTTVIETADAAMLDGLLGFVRQLVAKDKAALERAAMLTGAKRRS